MMVEAYDVTVGQIFVPILSHFVLSLWQIKGDLEH